MSSGGGAVRTLMAGEVVIVDAWAAVTFLGSDRAVFFCSIGFPSAEEKSLDVSDEMSLPQSESMHGGQVSGHVVLPIEKYCVFENGRSHGEVSEAGCHSPHLEHFSAL